MKLKTYYTLIALAIMSIQFGCRKLDEKPKQSLVVPTTLKDFQGLMDNALILNANYAGLGEASADNFYVTDASYNADSQIAFRNAYVWNKSLFDGVTLVGDWDFCYTRAFYSNVVLDGLEKSSANPNDGEFRNVKGQALFFRAKAFYMVAEEFSKPYNSLTASTDLGIPLRLSSDLNIPSKRATNKETYERILGDLKIAAASLPNTPLYKTRPGRAAAFGLLARIYLNTGDYENAFLYADSCLQINNTLINYNTLNPATSFPFTIYNNEVIFHATLANTSHFLPSRLIIATTLYQQYDNNDLRKTLFFRDNGNGTYAFKGSYNGGGNPLFCGIAADEVYLIRAESNARLGRYSQAMNDLNTLMANRFKTGTYINAAAANETEALNKILTERRKELLLRGLRWPDLKRLNKDTRYATTLTRIVNGTTFTLPANDGRYTFPIPSYIIALNGIDQNP